VIFLFGAIWICFEAFLIIICIYIQRTFKWFNIVLSVISYILVIFNKSLQSLIFYGNDLWICLLVVFVVLYELS
jgi:hypothetical protein